MENRELMYLAENAKQKSYSPYSKFKVGAALLTKDGKIYVGANIENSSYPLTVCAERVAFFKAISEGEKEFEKIAISGSSDDFCFPCGACRQVMSEFCGKESCILNIFHKRTFAAFNVKNYIFSPCGKLFAHN